MWLVALYCTVVGVAFAALAAAVMWEKVDTSPTIREFCLVLLAAALWPITLSLMLWGERR